MTRPHITCPINETPCHNSNTTFE